MQVSSSSNAASEIGLEGPYLSAKYIPSGRKFTVASFDGGGVRGIIPITIMHNLSKRIGLEPYEFIDMGTGTSTGGLLCAAYLGYKNDKHFFKSADLPDFWKQKIGEVFHHNCKFFFPHTDGIFWVKYSADGLEKVIGDIADETINIQSNLSSPVIIPAYDATAGRPLYFRSLDKTAYKLREVLRCTTAAPGYLPAAKVRFDDGDHALLDGGLVNNNPSLVGYIEAQKLAHSRNIQVLSFGTGEVDYKVSYSRLMNAGFLSVAPVVFNAFFASMENHPTQILKEALNDNFHRFQIYHLDSKYSELDDVSTVPYLEDTARTWVEDNNELLEVTASSLKPKFDPNDPYAKPVEF